ncbi:MAG TPA: hypothetical protein VFG95_08885 [Nitrospiria bacterium]|nr:hypothetical protein [Nitrospiria bacterium]
MRFMRLRNWIGVGGLLLLALFLGGADGGGCGGKNVFKDVADDSSTQAKIEAAKIDIDQQDYTGAITILEGICGTDANAPTCDSSTVSLLASAYMGRGGLNMLQMVGDSQTDSTWPCTFSLFSRSYGDVPLSQLQSNQGDLLKSLSLLKSIPSRTLDEGFQFMIGGMAELVVELGLISNTGATNNGYDVKGQPVNPPGSPAGVPGSTVAQVNLDLGYISTGLSESGLTNEQIGDAIKEVLTEFGTADATSVFVFLQDLKTATCS